MFNCGTGRAPTYLIELLSESVHRRQWLRSASDPGIRYDIPFNKKTRFNDRSFCTIGPKLWNNLPLYIKQSVSIYVFKKNLKTHYFFTVLLTSIFLSALELLYMFKHLLRPIMIFIYRTYILLFLSVLCSNNAFE